MSRRGKRVGVDTDRMRTDRDRTDRSGSGADLWKMEAGEHLVYICPPVHEEDPMVYVEMQAHFGVGPNNRMIVNLEYLEDMAPLQRAIEARDGIDWDDCVEGWEHMGDYAERTGADRIQIKPRWLFNVVPMQFRRKKGSKWEPGVQEPCVLQCGKTIYNGITDLFFDEGDITDPDAAILVKITKKGSGLGTEYAIVADTKSLKEPIELDEETWELIEEYLEPGGRGDLYTVIARWCRTKDKVIDAIEGTEDSDDDDDEEEEERKAATKVRTASKRRRKKPEPEPTEPEPEEEDEPEEEAPEPPKKKPATRRRKKTPEPEPEPEEEEDEPEEEAPEPPKKKTTRRRKKAPEPEPEEDEEEEEEEDDSAALEAALKARSGRRRKKR